jgi:hypothetical protein
MGLIEIHEKQISGCPFIGNPIDDLAAATSRNEDQLHEFVGMGGILIILSKIVNADIFPIADVIFSLIIVHSLPPGGREGIP